MEIQTGGSRSTLYCERPWSFAITGGKMENFEVKQFGQTPEDIIKEETFDEFLQRAYNQLTPEEQIKIRQKY